MTHTPTPWEVGRYNDIVFDGEIVAVKGFALSGGPTAAANTAFIVKAVNAHEHLVGALIEAFNELSALETEGYAFGGMDRIAAVLAAVE